MPQADPREDQSVGRILAKRASATPDASIVRLIWIDLSMWAPTVSMSASFRHDGSGTRAACCDGGSL